MATGFHCAGAVCALVGLLMYVNTLDCDMVFDDEPAIKWNQDLRPHTPWSNLLLHDFWGSSLRDYPNTHKSYRPLCVATFRLNYLLHELQPMGYHLVNVLLHSAVCYLYVQLCGVVFSAVWPALIAGLLFAVHPIHTEAVAGLVGRAETLAAFFFLTSFFCYRNATLSTSNGSSLKWLTVSLLLAVCSMISKEQGITVVALCLTYDFSTMNKVDRKSALWPFQDSKLTSPSLKQFLKRGVVLAIFTMITLALRLAVTNGGPTQKVVNRTVNPPTALETPYRQLSWLHLCFVNSWLLLSPSRLSADWRFGAVPVITSLVDPRHLLTVATLVAVTLLTVCGLAGSGERHKKTILFAISLVVFPFIPASNLFFPVGFVVAERVLYLPSMGFCMLVGYGAWCMIQRMNKSAVTKCLLTLAITYLIAIHSLKTLVRNRSWHSSFTIYSTGVRFNPRNGVMLSNLGIEYAITKDYAQAELLYKTSVEVAPSYSRGFYNLGKLLKMMHRYHEAEEPLQRAIELGNDTSADQVADTYSLLIDVISTNPSRLEEVLELCDTAISTHPHYAKLHAAKGRILLKLNRTAEALTFLEEAIKINSGMPSVHYHLGIAHMKLGNQAMAERAFRDVLLLDRDSTHAMFHLATVLQGSGDVDNLHEAKKLWLQIVMAEPRNKDALLNLAQVYYNLEDYRRAEDVLRQILNLAPLNKDALYMLGYLHYRQELYSEAIATLQRLVQIDPTHSDAKTLLNMAQKHTLQER